ncbi:hypothetical protein ILUMI_25173 [Ignelater luminosus]|uniref:Uncharacterized protein n=1 Tax=Ignelater luminosus TaxID=2038154 RepID=A0A8K0C545_IGNLU|nr:hypothetical protein ILUMI_25173 [Ignelater luminosus]
MLTATYMQSCTNQQDSSKKVRNRQRRVVEWKCNVRKRRHVKSEECISVRNKLMPAKRLKITKNHIDTVTQSAYRHISLNKFNLHLLKRRKDKCDLCEEVRLLKNEARLSDEKQASYESHILEKTLMREEKQKDRADNQKAVLCFDLQNVLHCSKAKIGQFYNKIQYRTDIASALSKIIEEVLRDNPKVTEVER